MKKSFYYSTVTALIAGALSFSSCTEKDGQSPPKIVVEYPYNDIEYYIGDSIRLKYSVEDADKISTIKASVKFDLIQKPLLSGVVPAPIYDKTYTNVGDKFAIDEKFKISISDMNGRDKNHFLIEIAATDSDGNTYKYNWRIYVSSL